MTRRVAAAISLLVGIVLLGTASNAQPLSVTINNKTVLPIVRGWEAPDGGVLSLVNVTKQNAAAILNATTTSPNPFGTLLNETKKTVSGKEKYVKETAAIAFGKGNTTTLLDSISLGSGSSLTDMTCVVDPKTGSLLGLQKAGTSLCASTGSTVTVPTSKGFISQIKAAYNYDGATIGRLVFEVKTAPNATAQRIACGTAGGKAFDLLPKNYVVTSLGVACAPATGSGRKLHQSPVGISAEGLTVEAGPVSALEAEVARLTAAGITGFGVSVDLYDSALPQPPPGTPTVISRNATLSITAATVVISGTGFDAITPAHNTVDFNLGAFGSVTAATATTLTVSFTPLLGPLTTGMLTAVVTSFGRSSGEPVQVATITRSCSVSANTVTSSSCLLRDPPPSGLPTGAPWRSVASSSDGTKLAAVATGGGIWLSSNSGMTWSPASGPPTSAQWTSIASSSDGNRLAAAAVEGIWLSTNSGMAWTLTTSRLPKKEQFLGIASSANGSQLAAVSGIGNIYLYTDALPVWQVPPGGGPQSPAWDSIASSASGTKLFAGSYSAGPAYMSQDSGYNWSQISPIAYLHSISTSADGNTLAAIHPTGALYVSGATFPSLNAPLVGSAGYTAVALSANGSNLAACEGKASKKNDPGGLSGRIGLWSATPNPNYTRVTTVPSAFWSAVAMSADRTKLVATASSYDTAYPPAANGNIWVSSDSGVTWLRR